MRTYKSNLYLGFMDTNLKKYNGKIARVCNGKYFSVFMKINDNDYFDLENDKLCSEANIFIVEKIYNEDELSVKELNKYLTSYLKQKRAEFYFSVHFHFK